MIEYTASSAVHDVHDIMDDEYPRIRRSTAVVSDIVCISFDILGGTFNRILLLAVADKALIDAHQSFIFSIILLLSC